MLALTFLYYFSFPSWVSTSSIQKLDPKGKNVCQSPSVSMAPFCCSGWKQQGTECTIPICEGENACKNNELCVAPGFCRCKHGFFGANCITHCPNQYWGPDCKNMCECYPTGKCNPVTGVCTCMANYWGTNCKNHCQCGAHGHCNQQNGTCQCQPGWWGSKCQNQCLCNMPTSRCDPDTGHCHCRTGYWGKRCAISCTCHISPCDQNTGRCECKEGWWGRYCNQTCHCQYGKCNKVSGTCDCNPGFQGIACNEQCLSGYYGKQCKLRCGHCKNKQSCSPLNGSCHDCDPGWNGTLCNQPCSQGFFGVSCNDSCSSCLNGETCNPVTGECHACEPGWSAPRCDSHCSPGTFGSGCQHSCSECCRGNCHHISGECICQPGLWGNCCNMTCPEGKYGVNCSSDCQCFRSSCNPKSGICEYSLGGLLAGILFLLLLILLVCIICCCCGVSQSDTKDRVAVGDGSPMAKMKNHVQGVIATLASKMPCLPLWTSKLPLVTVSHHDAELNFNHSFIEPPSTGWASDGSFSSFESDEAGPVYCVPPQEGVLRVTGGEFQENSSKCNMFPDIASFNSDDVSEPFPIPRTSSMAKAKRPSVSFAEGTKFGPEVCQTTETPNASRKSKTSWALSKLSSIQLASTPGEEPHMSSQLYECNEIAETSQEEETLTGKLPLKETSAGRRRTISNAKKVLPHSLKTDDSTQVAAPKGNANEKKISTVYVTVGKTRRTSLPGLGPEGCSDGRVQAALKRLGSLQKIMLNPKEELKQRPHTETISKPPRRSLILEKTFKRNSLEVPTLAAESWRKSNLNSKSSRLSPNVTSVIAKLQEASSGNSGKKSLGPSASILRKNITRTDAMVEEPREEENKLEQSPEKASRAPQESMQNENVNERDTENIRQTCKERVEGKVDQEKQEERNYENVEFTKTSNEPSLIYEAVSYCRETGNTPPKMDSLHLKLTHTNDIFCR
ncbi:scavenger receptor class F member 1 [Protopterus annectens]|uniref:scavenger receptor class F member 1 n=1 Tax=Protopterus annectens TaxID=7888 RepID=UPI001CFC1980|nr:scavenger receptor class F member 1 [Protopterus annectens]